MKKPTLFGMISSKESIAYTRYALNSFFSTTQLSDEDAVMLIDNDDSWDDFSYPYVNIVKNQQKKSFAANINHLIQLADQNSLDLIVMNNDIVFTEGWRESLELRDDIICLPSCNQTHIYNNEQAEPIIPSTMTLEQYANRWDLLTYVANHHVNANSGYYERFHTAFYLFRLPRKIYKDVGSFDESFAPCGGEDVDYRIRAALKGYQTLYTNHSYVLHFHGKSTWAGSETDKDIERRNSQYFNTFAKKYSDDCANLFLQIGNSQPIISKYELEMVDGNDFLSVLGKFFTLPQQQSSVSIGDVSAPGLLPYIENLGNNLIGCELGVCLGFTLRYFLDKTDKVDKVYAIDSYKPYMDHWGQVTQEMVDRWKSEAVKILDPHLAKIQWIYADSWQAADLIKDNELDYIFIDGDHSYAAVASDIRKYYQKVKPGGIFAGHDWNLPTVKKAVEHFRQDWDINSKILFTEKNVWFWYKEK